MITSSLVIIGHHQTQNVETILNAIKTKPDQLIYAADRPTPEELEYLKSFDFELITPDVNKAEIIRQNNGFFAPYIRNKAYEHATGDIIISLDGDMVPQTDIVEEYKEALSKYSIVEGKRLEEWLMNIDQRELYNTHLVNVFEYEQPITDKDLYFKTFNVLWSCNFGFTRSLYNLVREFNLKHYGRLEFFNSYFNGTYGGEDTALGATCWALKEYVAAIDIPAKHIEHPRISDMYKCESHKYFTDCFLEDLLSKIT